MVFDLTKSYVPESYVNSRDYRVFLRQLSMLITAIKGSIDDFPNLYIAENCAEDMLPLLASMVGYKYQDSYPIDTNRKIISHYPYLLRHRGSAKGIKMAALLGVNSSPGIVHYYDESYIVLDLDVENGVLNIYYPQIGSINWDLIEAVRPIGMRINLIPSEISGTTSTLKIKDRVKARPRHKSFDTSEVGKSNVLDSIVTEDKNEGE